MVIMLASSPMPLTSGKMSRQDAWLEVGAHLGGLQGRRGVGPGFRGRHGVWLGGHTSNMKILAVWKNEVQGKYR